MPKIAPNFPGATPSVRAGVAEAVRANSRSDRSGGFEQILSGARRREQPARADADRAEAPAAKPKPAKSNKPRAAEKRDATDAGPAPQTPRAEADDTAPVANDAAETEAKDDSISTRPAESSRENDGVDAPAEHHGQVASDDAENSPAAIHAAGSGDLQAAAALVADGTPTPPSEVADDTAAQSSRTAPSQAGVARVGGLGQAAPSARHASDEANVDGGAGAAQPGEAPQGKFSLTSSAAGVVESFDASPDADAPVPAAHASPVASPGADGSARGVESLLSQAAGKAQPASVSNTPALPPVTPDAQFAEDNHPTIVAGVRGQLMPSGGTMRIRLDPPELGPLSVTVRLRNGVMEASFETSSDDAARLLSHSLGALKTSLESQGVSVERLHVQQAPKSESSNPNGGDRDQEQAQNRDPQQEHAARQEHQRREVLRRMWRKLTGAEDPLDMVA